MLRICHNSDNHGNFPVLYGKFSAVLNSGDFFPNSERCGNKPYEMEFQLNWLRNNIENGKFKEWLGNCPFLYVPGNHDFLPHYVMEEELRKAGIEAYDLTDQLVEFQGFNFYGFPYIPYCGGFWNYELQLPEMQREVDLMVAKFRDYYKSNQMIDVLVAHSPPYGNLDVTHGNSIIGNIPMANALDYKMFTENLTRIGPSYYCCGHEHSSWGVSMRNDMLLSNAATSQIILELK